MNCRRSSKTGVSIDSSSQISASCRSLNSTEDSRQASAHKCKRVFSDDLLLYLIADALNAPDLGNRIQMSVVVRIIGAEEKTIDPEFFDGVLQSFSVPFEKQIVDDEIESIEVFIQGSG